MRFPLCFSVPFLVLGCAPKEESSDRKPQCEAEFTLDFTLADGSTDQTTLSACGGINLDAGFEFGDEPHLRYVNLGLLSDEKDVENCYLVFQVDPFCGNASYIFDGPTGYAASGALVLNDCADLPEGADTSFNFTDGDISLTVGYKDPGSTPGKTIKTALNGSIEAEGSEGGVTVAITGEFKVERYAVAGEVEETICD